MKRNNNNKYTIVMTAQLLIKSYRLTNHYTFILLLNSSYKVYDCNSKRAVQNDVSSVCV